jgi:hypothetical protein
MTENQRQLEFRNDPRVKVREEILSVRRAGEQPSEELLDEADELFLGPNGYSMSDEVLGQEPAESVGVGRYVNEVVEVLLTDQFKLEADRHELGWVIRVTTHPDGPLASEVSDFERMRVAVEGALIGLMNDFGVGE